MALVNQPAAPARMRVCVVGSGTRFLSGITVYTYRLANALAGTHRVSAILMRQLLPTRLYPGRDRVGSDLSALRFDPSVRHFDGVDWYWVPSILRALRLLVRERPDVLVFQWWSGTVFHTYLLLALVGRLLGARVVVEFHEVLDTGEANIPAARLYVRAIAPAILRLASGFVVHSEADRELLESHYAMHGRPVSLIPHGPYEHYLGEEPVEPLRDAPADAFNLLYFGVIRWYKGLEDLIEAFDRLEPEQAQGMWLTVVGETWEDYTAPAEMIARSRYRDRITFVNRYVSDAEVSAYFAGADAVVLPYRRASSSGPLNVAVGHGMPVVVTDLTSLSHNVAGYGGAVKVPPSDPAALSDALVRVRELRGRTFEHAYSWDETTDRYAKLLEAAL
jgi:glycosyltransferase involved in cell wall biosynthesis